MKTRKRNRHCRFCYWWHFALKLKPNNWGNCVYLKKLIDMFGVKLPEWVALGDLIHTIHANAGRHTGDTCPCWKKKP